MAPIIKRQSAVSAPKTVHRKGQARQVTQKQHLDFEDDEDDESNDDDHDMLTDNDTSTALTTTEPLTDLRTMADRVGRQVDSFAETLDKYNDRLRGPDGYEAAHELCISYKDFANDIVRKLRKKQEVGHVHGMKDSFGQRETRSSSFMFSRPAAKTSHAPEPATIQELKQWQGEANTWELFRIMLELRYGPSDDKEDTLRELGPSHRYEDAAVTWQRFLINNDSAKERYAVMKWLEQAADYADNDELQDKAGRGATIWTNGWMETRERIKGVKRMHVGDGPVQDVRRRDNNDLLVSSLDPDAPSRQQRTLEKADALSERLLWTTCWEMLRRGKPWSQVREWCLERNQSWRALSIGTATQSTIEFATGGPAAGALFRRMCYVAAKSATANEYEAAVYGLLSGDLDTVRVVCKSWDDHVYAHYSALLLAQFDKYVLQHHPAKLTSSSMKRFGLPDVARSGASARDLIATLAQDPNLSDEAQAPLKLLQASLLSDTFQAFCAKVGIAISDAAGDDASVAGIQQVTRSNQGQSGRLQEAAISDDPDSLRIAAHMLIILREIDSELSDAPDADAMDNVLAAYIQLLRAAGKRDLTPLYASKMAEGRCVASLAQVLSDINDANESMEFVKLLGVYEIDAIAVLKGQYMYLLKEAVSGCLTEASRFSILERTQDELYPGQRIRLGCLSDELTATEHQFVDSLSVYHLVDGQWTATFDALGHACRELLVNGHVDAALALIHNLPFEELSLSKSASVIGRALNVADPDHVGAMMEDPDRVIQIQSLQRQSQTYYELTLLLRAVEALEAWRVLEHEYVSKSPRPSSVPAKVKKASAEVSAAMEPLLGGILQHAADEEEAADLARIRTLYLPEIILAYNTVLCSAGHLISRDELLTAMDLSTIIANEQSGLGEAFVQAGRVRELVTALAETSKVMLKLNEQGKARKERKSLMGRSLGLWEING